MKETNPFQQLEEEYPAPEHLKEKVMTSVELSQLIGDIADLFVDKMGKTALNLFKLDDEDSEKNQS